MNEQYKKIIVAGLKSGILFGIGIGVGNIVAILLFNGMQATEVFEYIPTAILYVGLVLALLAIAISGFVWGVIGGLSLPRPEVAHKSRIGFAWRTGLSLAVGLSLVLYPLGWGIVLFSFYSISETDSFQLDLMFTGFGLLMGIVSGLILGLSTIGRRGTRWVVLAGALGFGLGGLILGFCTRHFLLSMTLGDFSSGNGLWMMVGLIAFGFVGGTSFGAIYSFMDLCPEAFVKKPRNWSRRKRIVVWVAAILGILIGFLILSPVVEAALDIVRREDAGLAQVLGGSVTGTHWADTQPLLTDLPEDAGDVSIAGGLDGRMALVWAQDGDVFMMMTQGEAWQQPMNISQSAAVSAVPQVVLDSAGSAHVVWQEANQGIFANKCGPAGCEQTFSLTAEASCADVGAADSAEPALAVDADDNLLAVWRQGEQLLYRSWAANNASAAGEVDCIPDVTAGQPRLAADDNGRFHLTFNSGIAEPGGIYTMTFDGQSWGDVSDELGNGRSPEIMVNGQGAALVAWCDEAGQVYLRFENESEATTFDAACQSRPALAQDVDGQLHVVWYGSEVENNYGRLKRDDVLFEAAQFNNEWTKPAILARSGAIAQPDVSQDRQGNLNLTWMSNLDGAIAIASTTFTPYSCDDYPLASVSQIAYDTVRNGGYYPNTEIIPYCQNQYQRLNFLPKADPSFSDLPPTLNGGFDDLANLIKTAKYEVLFSTMWYNADENQDSPGFVVAQAVADLYEQLQNNPERYPRGLTVRILLGNPPEFGLGSYSGQVWNVLGDLRAAGVDTMVDEELGWRLEVANFDGAWPHSHTKILVVDGKEILAAGFNLQYEHYAADHPSGLGGARQDLGIQVAGPLTQTALRVYDDLWIGAQMQICPDLSSENIFWFLTCRPETAVPTHVPEVRKYYLPGGDSTAFSLYRTKVFDEADQTVANSIAGAQHSIDTMQVMFTLEMVCDLNILIRVCSFAQAPGYLSGLVQAAENGANVRLIVKPQPTDGIESFVAIRLLQDELGNRGLSDKVQIRLFNDPVHYKTTLIDDELLIVGSQNFHYSAFGEDTGLTEYSLGVDDPQAVVDYKRLFERQWERSTPLESGE